MAEFTQKPLVLALMGPTASGKTDLAMKLSDRLPTEIISVDSALVYRDLNIGAAKPSCEELKNYPHHLVDIRDPSEPYSAANFCDDAQNLITQITSTNRIPLLVGGTMLYFKALIEGMAEMPAANPQVREEIEAKAEKQGWSSIHDELARVDPESAAQIHPNHSQRLSRALEVYLVSGKTMTQLRKEQTKSQFLDQFEFIPFSIEPESRQILHQRIEQRFLTMLDNGFIEEVEGLKRREDLNKDLPAIRAVGYRQVWEYLDGDYDYDEMKERGIAATRQLAKRQLTWLRGWEPLNRLYTQEFLFSEKKKSELTKEILNYLPNLDL